MVLVLGFCPLLFLSSCSGDNQEAPVVSADLLSVGSAIDVSGAGGEDNTFSVESNCTWTVTSDVDWIHITSPQAGQGNGSGNVVFGVDESSSSKSRTGSLIIVTSDGIRRTIPVTQRAGDITLTVTPNEIPTFQYSGGSKTVSVYCNTSWIAESTDDWLTIEGATTHQGNEGTTSVTIRAGQNESPDSVSGSITFRDLDNQGKAVVMKVTVEGNEPYIIVTNPGECSALGGKQTITVSSNYGWRADMTLTPAGSWAKFQNNQTFYEQREYSSEPVQLELTVEPNTSKETRTLSITGKTTGKNFDSKTIQFTQAAGTEPTVGSITFNNVTHKSATVTFQVATSTFDITTVGIRWSASLEQVANSAFCSAQVNNDSATVPLDNLESNTQYYVRAYVTNAVGTTVSDVYSFTTAKIPGRDDNETPEVVE